MGGPSRVKGCSGCGEIILPLRLAWLECSNSVAVYHVVQRLRNRSRARKVEVEAEFPGTRGDKMACGKRLGLQEWCGAAETPSKLLLRVGA